MEGQSVLPGTKVSRFGELTLSASAIAIGAFDGVHRGHQYLIGSMTASARSLGVPSVVYTFDPPPKVFFGGTRPIISIEEKIGRLAALEPDHIVVVDFDEHYRQREAAAFLQELGQLNPQVVWVGDDFRFGACKAGNPDLLAMHFHTRIIDRQCCSQGRVISSSRIRALSAAGDGVGAAKLQGWSGLNFSRASRESAMGA
jgi:FAD synthase